MPLKPSDTKTSVYSHYEAEPGSVYLHLDTDVKNLGKQNLSCEDILSAAADYNNGYTYSNIISITPLEALGVHFIFKCPQEVEESTNPLFVTLEPSYTKDSYILTVR